MNNSQTTESVAVATRLNFEDIAFSMGFCDKLINTLVADLLQGVGRVALDIDRLVSLAPGGLHLRKELRQAVYQAGCRLDEAAELSAENINAILADFKSEIASAAKENGIMASTGDCRGACKYNTGDSSEYRNYGW